MHHPSHRLAVTSICRKTLVATAVASMLLAGPAFAIQYNFQPETGGNHLTQTGVLQSATLTGTHAQSLEFEKDNWDGQSETWIHSFVQGATGVTGENLNLSYTLIRDTSDATKPYSVAGGTLWATNAAAVTLTGDTTGIALDVQGGYFPDSQDGVNSAVFVEGNSQLNFNAATTTISAKTGDTGPAIAGIGIENGSSVTMNGTNVTIDVESTSTAVSPEGDYFPALGVYMKGGDTTFTTAEGTTLNINVKNTTTGSTPGDVHGFDTENSTVNLNGTTVINVSSIGSQSAEVVGMQVKNEVENLSDTIVKVNNLTVTASGQGPVTALELGDENPWINDKPVNQITFTSTGDLNLTATQTQTGGQFVATGIRLDPYSSSSIQVNLNGKTTITAVDAIATRPWPVAEGESHDNPGLSATEMVINVAGDLTANGNVNRFHGTYNQTGGTTTFNTTNQKFIAGSTYIKGGTFITNATYDSTDLTVNKPSVFKMWAGSKVTIPAMNIGDWGTQFTYAKVYGGDLTLNTLTVSKDGKLGFNEGTITITESAVNNGRINLTEIDEENKKPGTLQDSTLVIAKGATFENASGARLQVNSLIVDGGTFTTNGRINGSPEDQPIEFGKEVVVKNGGAFYLGSTSDTNFSSYTIEENSKIVIEETQNLWDINDTTANLAGGQLLYKAVGSTDEVGFDAWNVMNYDENPQINAVVNITQGQYETKDITLGNAGRINVSGNGSLTTDRLNIAVDGTLTVDGANAVFKADQITL
ncbi:MAG: hypothetical protein Q4E62_08640 [Sutterellaceae bacterium]|nr:hypothetical protein [Sutterellaceae bacterium]